MIFLNDACAVILSSVALQNGLKTTEGMVAVYGKGNTAHSLYIGSNLYGNSGAKIILAANPNSQMIKLSSFGSGEGAHFCLRKDAGINGLEQYLRNMGFQMSNYEEEMRTADEFFQKDASQLQTPSNIVFTHSGEVGRKIAAAVTTGRADLTGTFGSASSDDNQVPYKLRMGLPLHMGELKMIYSQEDKFSDTRLVYINGDLRIIMRRLEASPLYAFDIHPRLDKVDHPSLVDKSGLMNRKTLDAFFERQFTYTHAGIELNTNMKCDVYLGFHNRRKVNV